MKITICSINILALSDLLPTLPWNLAAGTDVENELEGQGSPDICLRVEIDSIVDDCKELGHWWTMKWPNLGE